MVHYAAHLPKKNAHALLLLISVVAGCGRTAVVSPEKAFREIHETKVGVTDDLNFAGLTEAIALQSEILRKGTETPMKFGSEVVSRKEYGEALSSLSTVIGSNRPREEKLLYIRDNFRFLEWYGGKDWGEILLTSYFEPVIPGSLKPTSTFSQPLYARPHDLVVVDLKKFSERFKDESGLRGRLHEGHVGPYFSRSDIDNQGVPTPSFCRSKGPAQCGFHTAKSYTSPTPRKMGSSMSRSESS
jgi:MltA specific insert domain